MSLSVLGNDHNVGYECWREGTSAAVSGRSQKPNHPPWAPSEEPLTSRQLSANPRGSSQELWGLFNLTNNQRCLSLSKHRTYSIIKSHHEKRRFVKNIFPLSLWIPTPNITDKAHKFNKRYRGFLTILFHIKSTVALRFLLFRMQKLQTEHFAMWCTKGWMLSADDEGKWAPFWPNQNITSL